MINIKLNELETSYSVLIVADVDSKLLELLQDLSLWC